MQQRIFCRLLADAADDSEIEVGGETRWSGAEGLSSTQMSFLRLSTIPTFIRKGAAPILKDMVAASAVNFYGEGVSREEVDRFYAAQEVPGDPDRYLTGSTAKVVKENGKLVEKKWKVGGIYSSAIERFALSSARPGSLRK